MLLGNLLILASAALGAVVQYDDTQYDAAEYDEGIQYDAAEYDSIQYDDTQSIARPAGEIYHAERCNNPAVFISYWCRPLDRSFKSIKVNQGYRCVLYWRCNIRKAQSTYSPCVDIARLGFFRANYRAKKFDGIPFRNEPSLTGRTGIQLLEIGNGETATRTTE
ncbi:hypothetical protein MAC_04031 [Metarhizium acridum CQMa 102]|uniref:Uncharacterized protein n=1 Tax=Metarhizium acridum (strain CQMa 102) TaxID=655827 RepID=E9E2D3_METAQ|nr:uncharacterized protein MAC_04031 [Metarhizium acridum CQMa 102]EFY89822.1 hypothetical protein MAC_04031 [Metarhizium acridum CQMa 102]